MAGVQLIRGPNPDLPRLSQRGGEGMVRLQFQECDA